MQTIAIISGLIGALVSGVLSFGVRLLLDKRAQREAERRIAYVYLVRVSELVAADIIIRSFIKVYVPEEAANDLASANDAYEPSHKVSALLAEALSKLTSEDITEDQNLRAIPRFAKTLLDAAKESRFSSEQLSKLPQEAVFACHRFQNYHQYVCQIINMWSDFFENNERYWVTPEGIHDQWRALVRFADHARVLRAALIRYGAATPEQASTLMSAQVKEMHENIASKMTDKPRLLAAAEAAKKAVDSEPVV